MRQVFDSRLEKEIWYTYNVILEWICICNERCKQQKYPRTHNGKNKSNFKEQRNNFCTKKHNRISSKCFEAKYIDTSFGDIM